jgi:hypothetical protein
MNTDLDDRKSQSANMLQNLYRTLPLHKRAFWGEKRFQAYFKFGFVRNPWDRVVSLYLRQEGIQVRHSVSFEDFVRTLRYSSATCIHPSPHVNQMDWLVDPSGNIIVDYIGRFESLQYDWEVICRAIGLDPQLSLSTAKKNLIKQSHYSHFYNEETRDIVGRRFKRDIEFFGYKYESKVDA